MVTGTPIPISNLPTGTIDSVFDVVPLTIGITGTTPQTIQASLYQIASIIQSSILNGAYQITGTAIPNNGWNGISGTATYVSSDSPSFVVVIGSNVTGTFGVGTKIQLTHLSSAKNFFVTSFLGVTGSNTFVNLYGGTDYTLNVTGAITNPLYSLVKAPYGFPIAPSKWTVSVDDTTTYTKTSPSGTMWYNAMDSGSLPSFSVPIGEWNGYYQIFMFGTSTAAQTSTNIFATISSANNSESDSKTTAIAGVGGAIGTIVVNASVTKLLYFSTTTKLSRFLNIKTNTTDANINGAGASTATQIRIICAFL